MPSTSIRAQIGEAFFARLSTITSANGYSPSFLKFFYDDIPMGIDLDEHELPALFLLDEGGKATHIHQTIEWVRRYRIQIITKSDVPDSVLFELLMNCAKAVYANSPTAQLTGEFRSIHERIYEVLIDEDETDLHMIEANRIATMTFLVHYRCKPYEL